MGRPIEFRERLSGCRNNFLAIVQPLLAGLHAYTGLTINIIAGRINEETQVFETLSANAGVVGGKDWARWDPEGYSTTLKLYLHFVHAGYLEAHNLVDGMVSSSPSAGPSVVPPPPSAGPLVGPPPPDAFVGMNMLRIDDPDHDVVMDDPSAPPPLCDDAVDDMLSSGLILPASPAVPAPPTPAAPAATTAANPTEPAAPAPPAPALNTGPTPAAAAPTPHAAAAPAAAAAPTAPPAPAAPAAAAPTPAASAAAPAAPAVSRPKPKLTWGIPKMGEELGDALREKILGMEKDKRDRYLSDLQRMTPFYQQQEMYMARNERTALEMGLLGATKRVEMEGEGGRRRKKDGERDEEEWDGSEDSDEEEGEDSDEEEDCDQSGPERTPVKTRRGGEGTEAKETRPGAKLISKAPTWAENAKKILSDDARMGACPMQRAPGPEPTPETAPPPAATQGCERELAPWPRLPPGPACPWPLAPPVPGPPAPVPAPPALKRVTRSISMN
ncbi:hypothetical protein K438DRAFT_2167232 [Mycena galopus ATCC 62051]|nr:hypothetical protein K438DRAFT_2167232 [Mycena galopus ATCC 62051]